MKTIIIFSGKKYCKRQIIIIDMLKETKAISKKLQLSKIVGSAKQEPPKIKL